MSQPTEGEHGSKRMAGCESTNHTECYGELWQCAACGKTVCYAEGTDNHPELCDDCWAARFAPVDSVDIQGAPFTQNGSLVLVCDCAEEPCGAWLELTHDGFLVVEDKDGLLVSFMLPEWLDFAMRSVMLAHTATEDDAARTQTESAVLGRLEKDVSF